MYDIAFVRRRRTIPADDNYFSAPAATGPDTTNYVVQRDGTFVVLRDGTQVVDQRP